ncbi:MAG TPA: hypothetical protein ACFCUY_14300 [Xenococcaceae cyanobacterium]|jgi:hypothetical protein
MNWNKLFSKSAFLLLLTTVIVACDTTEPEAVITPEDETVTQTEENVTTGEVAESTDELIGQIVTIRSDAVATLEPSVFTVADQEFFGGEDIVVINNTGEPFELPTEDDTEVQITGEVTELVVSDLESEYGLDLDPELYVEYSDRPAIIAEAIALAPEPGEITSDPSQYYGETLAVTGEVANVYGENTFTIEDDELLGGENLLVVVTDPTTVIDPNETVAVTGELRSFTVADIERDYDIGWDLDIQREIETEYTNEAVLVVDRVYPTAIPGATQ